MLERGKRIGQTGRSLLALTLLSCILLVGLTTVVVGRIRWVVLSEAISTILVALVLLRPSLRVVLYDRRVESRLFFLAGLASSLVVVSFAVAPVWAEDRSIDPHGVGALGLFIFLGTVAGAVFPILRRRLPVPTIAASILFAFMLHFVFISIKPITYIEIQGFIPNKGPGFLAGLAMWSAYGILLGLIGRYHGVERLGLSHRQGACWHLISIALVLLVAVLWFSPIPLSRSRGRIEIAEQVLPDGFMVRSTYSPGFLRLAEFDLYNDLHWGSRFGVYLCISHHIERDGTCLDVAVYKGWRKSVDEEMELWQQYVQGRGGTAYVYPVKAPKLGDRNFAWETGVNANRRSMNLFFSAGRFLVQIQTSYLSEASPDVSWEDVEALGKAIEASLRDT